MYSEQQGNEFRSFGTVKTVRWMNDVQVASADFQLPLTSFRIRHCAHLSP